MTQEKRVVLFVCITVGIMYLFSLTNRPDPSRSGTGASGLTSGTTTQTVTRPAAVQTPEREASPPTQPSALERTLANDVLRRRGEVINIRTNVFDIDFDTVGARPRRWDIIAPEYVNKHPGAEDEDESVQMIPAHLSNGIQDLPLELYARLFGSLQISDNLSEYQFETREADGKTILTGTTLLDTRHDFQLQITKTFTFDPDSFLVDLKVRLDSVGPDAPNIELADKKFGLGLSWGPGIGQYDSETSARQSGVAYVKAAMATNGSVLNITPGSDDITRRESEGLWVAIKDKSFMVALIAADEAQPFAGAISQNRNINQLPDELDATQAPPYTVIAYGPAQKLNAGESVESHYKIFVGPMNRNLLREIGYELKRITFFDSWDWFRALVLGMMYLLEKLYAFCGDYGIAIIILTLIVKILTYPLTHQSMKLNAKTQMEMAKIKPELEKINEKYKDDFQGKNKATMEAYKKHGINPMAPLRGCLPMLVQLPVMIALYRLLDVSVELRGEPFLWISDLSGPDELFALGFTVPLVGWKYFNLLPFLMAGTTVLTTMLSSTQMSDPNQRMMMYMMPAILLVMLYNLSSGLFLYWITGNIWQAIHQYVTTRILKKDTPATADGPSPPPYGQRRRKKK